MSALQENDVVTWPGKSADRYWHEEEDKIHGVKQVSKNSTIKQQRPQVGRRDSPVPSCVSQTADEARQ